MSDPIDGSTAPEQRAATDPKPLIAEDLLLLLFQPGSGTIAGENTLFYVLGGAVLTELALDGRVTAEKAGLRGTLVSAEGEERPEDEVLRSAFDYVAEKPREVQGLLAAIGPKLRGQLLDRLVDRGDLDREKGKALGIIPTTTLSEGDTGRRAELLSAVRAALLGETVPDARTASIAALVSASGALPTFDGEIPWTTPVIERAKAFERGDQGADAAAAAVTRTMMAIVMNSVVTATALAAR